MSALAPSPSPSPSSVRPPLSVQPAPLVRPAWTVAGRGLLVAGGLLALGAVHLRHRPATLCPLRALTGVPCPFCGGTTAAADLGRGELRNALAASPLAVGLLFALPAVRVMPQPGWWARPTARRWVVTGVLVAAEVWQLVRFHVLGL